MHNTITLDTIDNRSDDIALNWLADLLVVQNITAESILVRIGALDKPNDVDGSDIYVPPFTSVTHSVTSNQFGFSFGFPKVSPVPTGSPTTAILTFSQGEPVPTFSGMPITSTNATIVGSVDANITNTSLDTNSTITNASLPVDANITNATLSTDSNITNATLSTDSNITNTSLLTGVVPDNLLYHNTGNSTLGSAHIQNITLPTNIHSLTVGWVENVSMDILEVSGHDSNIIYWTRGTRDVTSWSPQTFNISAIVDSSIDLTYQYDTSSVEIWVIAHLAFATIPLQIDSSLLTSQNLRNITGYHSFLSSLLPASTVFTRAGGFFISSKVMIHMSSMFIHLVNLGGIDILIQLDDSTLSTIYTRFMQAKSQSGSEVYMTHAPFDFVVNQDCYFSVWWRNTSATSIQPDVGYSAWTKAI